MFQPDVPIHWNGCTALLSTASNDSKYFSFALIHPNGREVISIHVQDNNFLYLSNKNGTTMNDEVIRDIWCLLEEYDWRSIIGANISGFKRSVTFENGVTRTGTILTTKTKNLG